MGNSIVKGSNIIGDGMSVTINFKWLLQIIAATAIAVYAFWKLEGRIQSLERDMQLAINEIALHEKERKRAEAEHVQSMEERMSWYENEFNINPFSWGKKNN